MNTKARNLGTLTAFAEALVDALVAAGWSWHPVERRLRHDGSGLDVSLQPGSKILARTPEGGARPLYSRKADPVQAAHEVAALAVELAARVTTD